MFNPLSAFIGLRYTRAKRRNHFISFISLSSMLGVALGVAALIAVLSVMNGFEKELTSRTLSMSAHSVITGSDGTLSDWKALETRVQKHPELVGSAPFVEGQGMFSQGARVKGAQVRGIDPALEGAVSTIAEKIETGDLNALKPKSFGVLLGYDLARSMGVVVGDKITLITPHVSPTPAGVVPRLKRLNVVGTFKIGSNEYDSALAIMHVSDAGKLFKLPSGNVSGLRLMFDDVNDAPRITRELMADLPASYFGFDWTHKYANFFRALKMEKKVMFIILLLIVAVAAFNIVSTLIMVVTDKQADIAILRTLGMTPRGIMGVFIVQGTIIGFIGTILGIIGGVLLALNFDTLISGVEKLTGYQFFPPDVYLIDKFPSDLLVSDVVTIGITAFVLTMIATLYPAWRAAQTRPAEALRYD
jgi:lipoprotein-releasing system permease protein